MTDDEMYKSFPTICHYTKFDTVKKIIDNKNLWARHFSKLDDPSEILLAKDKIIKYLESNVKIRLKSRQMIEECYTAYMTDVFITSFTKSNSSMELEENDGILSMWRFYGHSEGQAGCCIEFDSKKLHKFYEKYFRTLKSAALVYDMVLYDNKTEYKNEIEKRLNDIFKTAENMKDLPADSTEKYVNEFVSFICLLKHQAFFEERELRMVIFTNPKVRIESQKNSHSTLSSLSDHIDIQFDLSIIKKIIVGPHSLQDAKVNELKRYLDDNKIDIPIFKSNIPFKMVAKN